MDLRDRKFCIIGIIGRSGIIAASFAVKPPAPRSGDVLDFGPRPGGFVGIFFFSKKRREFIELCGGFRF
jgi:hypothetical protein